MLECLIGLCINLVGGLGYQPSYTYNNYESFIGELAIEVLDTRDYTYLKALHISGINTPEGDLGFNSITLGLVDRVDSKTYGFIGIGSQVHHDKEAVLSNNMGTTLIETGFKHTFDNRMYFKVHGLFGLNGSNMYILSAGFNANLFSTN